MINNFPTNKTLICKPTNPKSITWTFFFSNSYNQVSISLTSNHSRTRYQASREQSYNPGPKLFNLENSKLTLLCLSFRLWPNLFPCSYLLPPDQNLVRPLNPSWHAMNLSLGTYEYNKHGFPELLLCLLIWPHPIIQEHEKKKLLLEIKDSPFQFSIALINRWIDIDRFINTSVSLVLKQSFTPQREHRPSHLFPPCSSNQEFSWK